MLQFIYDDNKFDEIPDHWNNIAILLNEVKLKYGMALFYTKYKDKIATEATLCENSV